jgi:CubicO group peptidase (beta-lactamase class C family)
MNRFLRRLPVAVLLGAVLLAALLPAGAAAPRSEAPQGIDASLQPFVDSHTLAGAVTLVASKDRVLSLETVGYADVGAKKPMHKDSIFWIASMSKPITATALMMLVDEGKVKVDDPVEKYLPEFKDQWLAVEQDREHILLRRPKHPITVRNILSHTSGMPFRSALEQPTLDLLPLRDAVRSYAITPLQFQPDSKYQYSNAGINTAGRIIEVVSGMPYEDFLQKRLFDPLGMKDTTFWPSEEQLGRLAKAYKPDADKTGLEETPITQLRYPLNDRKRQPMPAGGLFSTAADVGNFCRMVLGGGVFDGKRYLSEEAVRQMTSKQTGDLMVNYGLGWSTAGKPGGSFGHGGAYSTNMQVNPEKGLVLVLLVHHAGFPGKDGGKIHPTFVKTALEKFGK